MNKTNIEWTDMTVNPIVAQHVPTGSTGHYCEKISPGCANCYASRWQRRWNHPAFETPASAKPEEFTFILREQRLSLRKKPARIFWSDMTDLFGDWVPDGVLLQIWLTMLRTPWHTHQLLTKRPERLAAFLDKWNDLTGETNRFRNARGPAAVREAHPSGRGQMFAEMLEGMGDPPAGCAYPTFDWMEGPRWIPAGVPDHIHLGVSCEDQRTLELRWPMLAEIDAPLRWISAEPLLGPLELSALFPLPQWVVAGGESGPGARPMHPDWVRSLRDQCASHGVPFFYKQWGEFDADGNRVGKARSGRELDGRTHDELPTTRS
jgi:protein gp37